MAEDDITATTYTATAQPIKLVHSVREMRCYTVTDSELKQLGLANLAIAGTFGLGSGFLAFGLDVYKDVALAATIPEPAKILSDIVQPICFWTGVALWLFAAALFLWRMSLIAIIKKESKNA